MAADGTLRVRIVGDASGLQKTVKGAGTTLGGFAKNVAKIGAVASGAAVAGLGAAINKTAEYGDRVAKTSRQVGLGVEDFQELEFALGQAGLSSDQSTKALEKLNVRIGRAAQGEKTYQEAVEATGTSLRDANGNMRDQNDIFNDVLRGLGQMESGQEAAAVAADLFGTSVGPKLATAIQSGEDGIDELRQKAQDLGVVMDKDTAESSERFNDALDDLKQGLGGAVRTIGADLLPVLADKVVPTITKKVIPAIQDFFQWIGPKVETAMAIGRTAVEEWWPRAVAAFEMVRDALRPLVDTVSTVIDTVRTLLADNASTISTWQQTATDIFGQVRDTIRSVFDAVTAIISTAVNIATAFWDRFGRHIVDFTVRAFGRIAEIISGAFDIIKGLFDVITGVLTGDWDKAWNAIKQIVSGAWQIITNVISGAWDLVKTIFGAGVAAISQIWSFIWDQIKQVLRNAWDAIVDTIRTRLENAKATLSGIVTYVSGMPSRIARAASGMWDGITDAFKAAINWIISKWNNLRLRIGGQRVSLPFGQSFEIPSITLNTPNMPMLEQGGEVLKTGLAVVHRGERFSGTRDQFPIRPTERERPTFNVTQHFHGQDPEMGERASIALRKLQLLAVS